MRSSVFGIISCKNFASKTTYIFVTLTAIACFGLIRSPANAQLLAAVGKVDITPTRAAFLAGYSNNRKSETAHDRLSARCLVLDNGQVRIALVSCDLIGLPRFEILKIRALVTKVKPENVIVGGTHTHSGPDTLGMWGPVITKSGVDQEWLSATRLAIAKMVDDTASSVAPATLKFASTTDVGRVSKNIRVPRILDTQLNVMQVLSAASSKPVCTFVNYACHPEILNNKQITADFPHWLYETVESGGGGECIYFNGAQGGMITADFDENSAPKGANWKAAESIGNNLGKRTLAIIGDAKPEESAPLTIERRVFNVPLDNDRYKTLIALKVFSSAPKPDGTLETEVCRIGVGPAEFVTFPGEVLPNIGIYIKSLMHGKYKFQLGLTDDFLGYILTPEDFVLPLYQYESGQSVGPRIEPMMLSNLKPLIDSKH